MRFDKKMTITNISTTGDLACFQYAKSTETIFCWNIFFELVKPPEVCYRKPKHCLNPMVYGDTSISGKMPQGLKKLLNGCQRFISHNSKQRLFGTLPFTN